MSTTKGCGVGCLTMVVAVAALGIIGKFIDANKNSMSSPIQHSGCSDDWRACSDNDDLVNHWTGWSKVRYKCKDEANKQSKYGTPEWPWVAFGHFHAGTSYVERGLAIAIEPDAKFSNGFGAMVKVRVDCMYDLKSNSVSYVSVVEH